MAAETPRSIAPTSCPRAKVLPPITNTSGGAATSAIALVPSSERRAKRLPAICPTPCPCIGISAHSASVSKSCAVEQPLAVVLPPSG
ncbi:hypothetical protein LJC16_00320 [Bacteroidales bacterium OttesenSCG-928-C19]|nr:hypothetical protein [Bacteroidales bacterium OttesenSCG-928-C19]